MTLVKETLHSKDILELVRSIFIKYEKYCLNTKFTIFITLTDTS
jgi:hypothetical protein